MKCLKKVLYVILAIAFLIGTHLIAQGQNAIPGAQPDVSVDANENGAKASAFLDPVREALVEVGNPVSFTGEGCAYASVKYYFGSDEDWAPANRGPDSDPFGDISITLTATWETKKITTSSPHESKETTIEGSGGVGGEVSVPIQGSPVKVGGEAELEGSISQTQQSDSGMRTEEITTVEKKVTPQHDKQEAQVGGNANHHKYCIAIAIFNGLSASDCDSYTASFIEWLSFW